MKAFLILSYILLQNTNMALTINIRALSVVLLSVLHFYIHCIKTNKERALPYYCNRNEGLWHDALIWHHSTLETKKIKEDLCVYLML